MNKSERSILSATAFALSTVISASLLALFSSWAWTQLEPTQQATIAATNIRWDIGWKDRIAASKEANDPTYEKPTATVSCLR